MKCDYVSDKLYEYIYGELTAEEKETVEKHLQDCSACREEYNSMKKLLLDDLEPLTKLKSDIDVPPCLNSKIYESIKKDKKHRPMRYAAACLVFLLLYTIPVAAFCINQNNLISKYSQIDPNILENFKNKNGQLVGKNSSMKDITFTVDGIIKEKDKTIILFAAKLPKGYKYNYAMPLFSSIKMSDQFGRPYNITGCIMNLRDTNEEGEVKGIMEAEPVKKFALRLQIRVTAMELGNITLNKSGSTKDDYKVDKFKNIYGNWNVSFLVN